MLQSGQTTGSVRITPSGELLHSKWKITIFNGKIHYFYGHFQLLFVCSPEGTLRCHQTWLVGKSLKQRHAGLLEKHPASHV